MWVVAVALCLIASGVHAADDLFPSPIAPVWPTRYSAHTYGSVDFKGNDPLRGGHKNFSNAWFYDWPNARHLSNGSETFHLKNGTRYTVKYIRTWHGPTAKNPQDLVRLCDFDTSNPGVPVCNCNNFPKELISQVERPDGFVRSNMTFKVRETVIGVSADHFVGPVFKTISPAPFELWQDPTTNFPVLFAGPVGYLGATGTRFFTNVKAFGESSVRESVFDLDFSPCKHSTASALPHHLFAGPTLLDSRAMVI